MMLQFQLPTGALYILHLFKVTNMCSHVCYLRFLNADLHSWVSWCDHRLTAPLMTTFLEFLNDKNKPKV